jgi:hypothetical protein
MDIHWNLFPNVANEHVLASLQGTVWASRELKQIMDSVLPPKKKKIVMKEPHVLKISVKSA